MFAQITPTGDFDQITGKIKKIKYDADKESQEFNPEIILHPMRDWHLRSDFKNGKNAGGKIQMVWLFGTIGVFVLLLACINFMNLSTARSEKRAKEVGIRMTIGSVRSQLINQFLSESFLVVTIAFIVAVLFVTAFSLLLQPACRQRNSDRLDEPCVLDDQHRIHHFYKLAGRLLPLALFIVIPACQSIERDF